MQRRSTSISAVAKAAHVIKACQALGGGLSLGDLARNLNLPRSTVQRIVQTLVQEGFLASDGSARSIALGPEILAMGATASTNVVERMQPILRTISAETGETVDLSRLNGDHMVFLNQIAGRQRLQAVSAVGDTFPLHCTANGKAAMAALGEEELRRLLVRPLRKLTPKTLTDPRALKHHLSGIRKQGFAVDIEEHSVGICAVGIAIRDNAHQLYAVSIPVPTVRFRQCREVCQNVLVNSLGSLQHAVTA